MHKKQRGLNRKESSEVELSYSLKLTHLDSGICIYMSMNKLVHFNVMELCKYIQEIKNTYAEKTSEAFSLCTMSHTHPPKMNST